MSLPDTSTSSHISPSTSADVKSLKTSGVGLSVSVPALNGSTITIRALPSSSIAPVTAEPVMAYGTQYSPNESSSAEHSAVSAGILPIMVGTPPVSSTSVLLLTLWAPYWTRMVYVPSYFQNSPAVLSSVPYVPSSDTLSCANETMLPVGLMTCNVTSVPRLAFATVPLTMMDESWSYEPLSVVIVIGTLAVRSLSASLGEWSSPNAGDAAAAPAKARTATSM